jgi:protein-tyrosine phosphatase
VVEVKRISLPKLQHIVLPLKDRRSEDISRVFEATNKVIEDGLSRGAVLVHCGAGVSRVMPSSVGHRRPRLPHEDQGPLL